MAETSTEAAIELGKDRDTNAFVSPRTYKFVADTLKQIRTKAMYLNPNTYFRSKFVKKDKTCDI